jgi:hypothetical protein
MKREKPQSPAHRPGVERHADRLVSDPMPPTPSPDSHGTPPTNTQAFGSMGCAATSPHQTGHEPPHSSEVNEAEDKDEHVTTRMVLDAHPQGSMEEPPM